MYYSYVTVTFNLINLVQLCSSTAFETILRIICRVWNIFLHLQGLVKKSWALFSKDLTKMSSEFFQEAMPTGKNWKKSRQSGLAMIVLFVGQCA